MPEAPDFDQRGQSVNGQTNIGHADEVHIHQSRPAAEMPVPQQIPQYPKDFTGRDEDIKRLLDRFGKGVSMAIQKSPTMAIKFPQVYLRLLHFAVQA